MSWVANVVYVSGPRKVASFTMYSELEGVFNRGGINRTNALSPLTANILPIVVNNTAGFLDRLPRRSGNCLTRFRLKGAASALSVANGLANRFPIGYDSRRIHCTVRDFGNGVVRIPPVCSTISINNGELCRLTEDNIRIRQRSQRVRVGGLSVLPGGNSCCIVSILYSGNACVHSLVSSVNGGLNANTIVASLYHARTYKFSLTSYGSLRSLFTTGRTKRSVRGCLLPIRGIFLRFRGLAISRTRSVHFGGNNTLSTREVGDPVTRGTICEICSPYNRFLNLNVRRGSRLGMGQLLIRWIVSGGCNGGEATITLNSFSNVRLTRGAIMANTRGTVVCYIRGGFSLLRGDVFRGHCPGTIFTSFSRVGGCANRRFVRGVLVSGFNTRAILYKFGFEFNGGTS